MLTRLPPFDTYPAIAIEHVAPEIDGGRWPIKRVVGDTVEVSANVFKEGHDLIVVEVAYRTEDDADWQTAANDADRERPLGRARSRSRATPATCTRCRPITDVFGSWRADLQKRVAAGQHVPSELLEGVVWSRRRAREADAGGRSQRSTAGAARLERRCSARRRRSGRSWRACPIRRDCTRYQHELRPDRRPAGRALRRLVRDLSALAGNRSDAQRHLPRGRAAPSGDRRHGLRRRCT